MKDGFYLSTYVCINTLGYLYKSSARHDYNISLWKLIGENVQLIRYWELERLTGEKQHKSAFFSKEQFVEVVSMLLEEEGISFDDIIEIWGTPELGNFQYYFFENQFSEFAYHAICHAFSALLLDTKKFQEENILCLSVDSCPDNQVDLNAMDKFFYMGVYSEKGKLRTFPVVSPAEIWEAASDYYELREGTLMALAYASNTKLTIEVRLECHAIDYMSRRKTYSCVYEFLKSLDEKDDLDVCISEWDSRFNRRENIISGAMKILQKLSINIMENTIDHVKEKFGIDPQNTYLAISGGYGLNCPTNAYLVSKYHFKGFIAPPCINDSGMSLGCALYTFYKRLNNFSFRMLGAYQGGTDNTLEDNINRFAPYIENVTVCSPMVVAEDIANSVIIWFDGACEIGPRALGHRSLLANPCSNSSKERLNEIKQRQWWRPVAPIIMEEEIENWFYNSYESPYMLHNFQIIPEKEKIVPAILHLDNTSRVQTLKRESNPFLYDVIEQFKKKTGVPIICNTSLNDRGEPIIDTIQGVFNFALLKKISIIYINRIRIQLKEGIAWNCIEDTRKVDFFDYVDAKQQSNLKNRLNPYNCREEIIDFYLRTGKKEKLTDKKEVRKLELREKETHRKYFEK